MNEGERTIAAVATAGGRGALAVLRVSGPGAFAVCSACIVEREKFAARGAWMSGLYTLCDPQTGHAIDRVTAVKYRRPRSYTGEDMVEVTTHGGDIVPGRVLDALVRAGASVAGPGEFTRRAVLAGKMDVLSAEAVNALVSASRLEECQRALRAGAGEQRRAVREVESELRQLLAGLEAGIEFGVESDGGMDEARRRLSAVGSRLSKEQQTWERCLRGEASTEVVIAGVANAGKSTLFNLLAGEGRALVDREAGTTRDYLSETVWLDGERVRVVDTAGLGECGGAVVGVRGVRRSWERIREADGVVWVCPMDLVEVSAEELALLDAARGRLVSVVLSKRDLEVAGRRQGLVGELRVRVVGGNLVDAGGARLVREELGSEIARFARESAGSALIVNDRQALVVARAAGILNMVLGEDAAGEEAIADSVGRALRELGALSGQEEVLDTVFRTFCVGK